MAAGSEKAKTIHSKRKGWCCGASLSFWGPQQRLMQASRKHAASSSLLKGRIRLQRGGLHMAALLTCAVVVSMAGLIVPPALKIMTLDRNGWMKLKRVGIAFAPE
jgi:hypothetical protein